MAKLIDKLMNRVIKGKLILDSDDNISSLEDVDLRVKTLSQSEANESLSFSLIPTQAVEQYFTKLGEYSKIEVVNGELHIIACAVFQNTDSSTHDLVIAQQDILLTDSIARKIYGVETGKNLLEDSAGDVRIAPQTYSVDVDGSNKNVGSCRIFSTEKNHLRIIWNPLNNVGAGKKCSIYCEVNLSLF